MARVHASIHVNPRIAWQVRFAGVAAAGLRAIGAPFAVTQSRERIGNALPILLGTTFWRGIEASGTFLLVDRCSFGSPSEWVTLVLDGHGRRGDHRTPTVRDGSRWEHHAVEVHPWRSPVGTRTILCGQTEPYSPRYSNIESWYDLVGPSCTHFRRHPASSQPLSARCAASALPVADSWDDVRVAVTLNSSVAIDTVLAGIPTVTMDEAAMAWSVTSHSPSDVITPDRTEWLHWLAWTQWTYDEIREGTPWRRFL